jgi:hypothetical protein
MTVLGKRGYEIVKDKNNDPVKCGTLYMGVIPNHVAERRRQHFADEARKEVRSQEEQYIEATERIGQEEESGGFSPLRRGDRFTSMDGETRRPGIEFENV